MNNQFLETFLKEWDLYQRQGGTPSVDTRRSEKRSDDYDQPVRAGEIRVFADSDRQLVGLVYKTWGENGWIIVPVSDFSVPATEQEILIGPRVYQLWNSFTASASFVEKSWLIDTLSSADHQDICAALLHVSIGEPINDDLLACMGEKITSVEDPRLEYERTFVVNAESESIADDDMQNESSHVMRIQWRTDRRNACWEKYRLDESQYALAAATDNHFPKVPVLMYKDAWDAMQDGQLASQFCGYRVGDDKRWVTFSINDPLPVEFDGKDIFAVNAYRRTTRELVGAGRLKRMPDGSGRISVQFTADVADASEIVLVVEEDDGEKS